MSTPLPLERKSGHPHLVRMMYVHLLDSDHPIGKNPCGECDEENALRCSSSCGPGKVWATEATYYAALLEGYKV